MGQLSLLGWHEPVVETAPPHHVRNIHLHMVLPVNSATFCYGMSLQDTNIVISATAVICLVGCLVCGLGLKGPHSQYQEAIKKHCWANETQRLQGIDCSSSQGPPSQPHRQTTFFKNKLMKFVLSRTGEFPSSLFSRGVKERAEGILGGGAQGGMFALVSPASISGDVPEAGNPNSFSYGKTFSGLSDQYGEERGGYEMHGLNNW